jgi:transposase
LRNNVFPGHQQAGDIYLCTLLIHGDRAVVNAAKKDDVQSRRINELVKRRNVNIAAVAVANQNARAA